MLNTCTPPPNPWIEELKLRYWQLILRLMRAATGAHEWGSLFVKNRNLMALAFLSGILIGLASLIK